MDVFWRPGLRRVIPTGNPDCGDGMFASAGVGPKKCKGVGVALSMDGVFLSLIGWPPLLLPSSISDSFFQLGDLLGIWFVHVSWLSLWWPLSYPMH